MTPELTQKLYDAFPRLFRELRNPDSTLGERGFECDDKCFHLVLAASLQLTAHVAMHPQLADLRAVQVSEKLGSLRFRCRPMNDELGAMLEKIQQRSEALLMPDFLKQKE